MTPRVEIDILENSLRQRGRLLDILLLDRTTGKNIIWASDSYKNRGRGFRAKDHMRPELVTGIYGKLIQPRAAKSREEQRNRTKESAEVFTPLSIVEQMNKGVDWAGKIKVPDADNWQDYVKQLMLEISCGEAPFIVTRYNPTSHTGKRLVLDSRHGFLDRKLREVSRFCKTHKDWVHWAKEAFMASYGYEWQGDNVLIARENLLYTFIDYYRAKFNRRPTVKLQEEFAEIISWNIWQMDGLKYVIPMSCRHETKITPGDLTLFGELPDVVEVNECEGCKYGRSDRHNGRYSKVKDWQTEKNIRFVDLTQ